MMISTMKLAIAALALTVLPVQQGGPLSVRTQIFAETEKGLESPTRVLPGQRLVFQVTAQNVTEKKAKDVVIANPIPAQISYVGKYPGSPSPELSVDGVTFDSLSQLSVPDGQGGRRAATNADVRAVRWRVGSIDPGETVELKFRGTVK